MAPDDDPTTQELRALQLDRVDAERKSAQAAADEDAQRAHGRRAEKAAYLAEKLDEQAEALDE